MSVGHSKNSLQPSHRLNCNRCGVEFCPTPNAARRGRGACPQCEIVRRTKARRAAGAKPRLPRVPVYSIWRSMIQRCTNPECKAYPWYGGRGISVCARWMASARAFSEDMGERPKGMELDRIDNNGNYEPGNCRWATKTTQSRNRRNSHIVTFNGQSKTLAEWSEITGIPASTLSLRIVRLKWSVEKTLTTPTMSPSEAGMIGRDRRYGRG